MRKILKAILGVIAASCVIVLVYFIIAIIGNRKEVVNAYKAMTNTKEQGADNIRTNFLRVYGTYGEELFLALGMKKTDYDISGTVDSDTEMDEPTVKLCTCTSECTSETDYDDTCEVCKLDWQQCAYVAPCTCSGQDRCTSTNVDSSCEACKKDYKNCAVILQGTVSTEIGGTYEGAWYHVIQGTETYKVKSVNGTPNQHCFFVAMNAICSGFTGRQITLEDVFTADGQTWTCDPNTMTCKTSRDHNGGFARANSILSNMGISERIHDSATLTTSGSYLIYVSGNKNWSSGGSHWFPVHNGVLMTNAGNHKTGYKLTPADINDINKNHKYIGAIY